MRLRYGHNVFVSILTLSEIVRYTAVTGVVPFQNVHVCTFKGSNWYPKGKRLYLKF